ncbi:acyl-CoA synthetase (AMP-forming)/AMP-acid ligase II [Litoreibacter ponti]|uniref:Acyl-CoA synthetase (AMP-forming)/AMP-acid ligase II n=2 Tax=Litoreibacter ponti TaxID=1510457 RepID=A0A2T6BIT6_9RHOB|nr:acyl-CoA synthetase (AMP-forming)/AMP-acid ligase II [Litoreibacter ponti]
MAAYVLAHADRLAEKPALEIVGAETWSYGTLKARVMACAGGLLDLGLKPGDRVLFRLGNTAEFPVAYLACIWAGLVPVPASAALSVPEITEIARQTNPALVLQAPGISRPDHPAPSIKELPDGQPVPPEMGDPDRLAYIIFTSGTSGRPRGVCHAHRAIWARRMMWDGWYGLREDDRVMHAGAFNWTYTLGTGLMDPWSIGATSVIPNAASTELAQLLSDSRSSIFAAAPGIYRQLLKSPLPALPDLRHGLSAGERLSTTIRAAWQDRTGTEIFEALGMSECSTFISACPAAPALEGSSGRPQRGRRIAVIQDGVPVARGEPGQLAIHRDDPGLMLGYLNEPPPEGEWFITGDTVTLAEDGSITYLGRADDMMNAGGYRVSPLEVEAAFATVPGLQECAACVVEIKRDAHVIALFYVSDAPLPETQLQTHAERLLARFKQPRLYIHRTSLPKGGNGKLNRRLLRDTFEGPTQ